MLNKKSQEKEFVGLFVGILIFIVMLFFVFNLFYIINAGERGVLLTFGKPDPYPVAEGLHLKMPFVQSIIKMEVRTQKYEADASASSSDLQIVTAKIATNFHLNPESVPTLFQTIGVDYSNRIIQPMEQETVKATMAKYTAEQLITKREDVRQEIKQLMTTRLAERGIIVEEVSIVNFDFSPEFNAAIEAKVTQEQSSLAAKNKLDQIKYEAQQAQAQAEGQAQAIQLINDQLRANPNYIEWMKVQKWNGNLPTVMCGGSGISPFMDVSSLATSR